MADTKEIQIKKQSDTVTKEKVLEYLKVFGLSNSLTENEQGQFINIAIAYQLNPFKREIYCIPYETKEGRKLSIITGYEVYIKRAEAIKDLNGWKVKTEKADNELIACIEIYRKSWKMPFYHEVYFSEYCQNNYIWKTKPRTMLKKVVIGQGFRLCFPEQMGGLPYMEEELPPKMSDEENMRSKIEIKEKRKEILQKMKKIMESGYYDKTEIAETREKVEKIKTLPALENLYHIYDADLHEKIGKELDRKKGILQEKEIREGKI
jgi:phage recombination protein Bet